MSLFEVNRIDKPWGYEIHWAVTDQYVGKILFIKAGESLSRQYHKIKDETIYVLSGKMKFIVGKAPDDLKEIVLEPGHSYHIEPHEIHQMISIDDTTVLEASTPQLDDVVRLVDRYGREGTTAP